MTRRGPLLAATAVLAVALTACDPGNDPKPNYSSVTPTASASTGTPSPTGSPSPSVPTTGPNVSLGEVAPTEPSAASKNSAEGAQSYAAYYFKMLDWSYAVNRSDLMSPLFSNTCDNCSKLTANLAATFNRGTVTGTRVAISQIALVTNDGRAGAQFAVSGVLDISAGVLTTAMGTAPITAEPNTTITLWLIYGADGFRVVSQAKV